MRTKIDRATLDAEVETILNILRNKKGGMLSLDIANIAGFSQKKTCQLLIAMRNKNKVYCKIIDPSRNIRLWTIQVEYKAKNGNQIYPDLDVQHEEWCKRVIAKKPVYNPWGKQ